MDAMSKIYDLARDSKYSPNTFIFIHEVLQAVSKEAPTHLTGKQLTLAAFIFSVKEYGGLAKMVWQELGLESSEDIGQVVFMMVEAGLMGAQPEDKVEDFDNLLVADDFDRVELIVTGTGGKWKYLEEEGEELKIGYKPPEDLGSKLS